MRINMKTKFHERDNSHDEINSPFNNVKERWRLGAYYKNMPNTKKRSYHAINFVYIRTNKIFENTPKTNSM